MKKSRFSDSHILAILKQAEGGVLVSELCREQNCALANNAIVRPGRLPQSATP